MASSNLIGQREVYVFFWRRPIDPKPWPLAFEDRKLAEDFPHRCSPVVPVTIDVGHVDIRPRGGGENG